MKLTLIGGGSSYTPELVDGLLQEHAAFPVAELCLYDTHPQRLDILAGLSARMVKRAGLPVQVTSTLDLAQALQDAAFVNCLIRVGGMPARIQDEQIPLKYGIIGQETTGPGGMMKALRTIPPMLEIAAQMSAICPQAWLINYTNPSGIIAEALGQSRHTRWISLCSGPLGWTRQILKLLGADPQRAVVDWVGLNHLGFATRVCVDGVDVTEQAVLAASRAWNIDPEWMQALGAIPASYLGNYYHHGRLVAAARQPGVRTRGQVVLEIETELLRQYADPGLCEKPELLKKRGGGGYAEVALGAMLSIYHNRGDRQVVQTLNQGAVDDIPPGASMELACLVDSTGAHPVRFGPLPLPIRGLVQAVKAYESLTVQAARQGSRQVALQALMAHPLVPDYEIARPLLDELLEANRPWLPWV